MPFIRQKTRPCVTFLYYKKRKKIIKTLKLDNFEAIKVDKKCFSVRPSYAFPK